jgi:hypothetical protein
MTEYYADGLYLVEGEEASWVVNSAHNEYYVVYRKHDDEQWKKVTEPRYGLKTPALRHKYDISPLDLEKFLEDNFEYLL